MQHSSSQEHNTYFIEADREAELARLIVQGRQLTKDMGGLWPDQVDVSGVHDILDLACGPGEWVLDLARHYPAMSVMGVDIDEKMIRYADALVETTQQDNASFEVMDITKPLPIPDQSFDLINARLLAGVLPRTGWPNLLRECWRVLRPGGRVRLSEIESPITTSASFERLNRMVTLAMQRAGYGFSPDGYHIGLVMMIEPLLVAAKFSRTQTRACPISLLKGSTAHQAHYENVQILYPNLKPLLLKTGVTDEQEFASLYQQNLHEMQSDGFHGLVLALTAWGVK